MAVCGDARFASHHDMLRAVARLAVRANLPLHYTQGFNPHAVMSLPLPRPVGVESYDDMLCISLEEDISPQTLVEKLNANSIPGLKFTSAELLQSNRVPLPQSIDYRIELTGDELEPVGEKVWRLSADSDWPVQRQKKPKRGKPGAVETINVKPRVSRLEITGSRLDFTLVGENDCWAKPSEVLALVGLNGLENVARLIRTKAQMSY